MPRLPLLALTLILLAGASAQLALADDAAPPQGASVTIAPSGGGGAARTLALADLAGQFDVHGRTYTLREADGTTSTVTVADGISLTALLTVAGFDADAFTYLEIPGANGSSAIVLRDDLGGGDEGPPVVWSDEQGIHFLRPSNGARDANGADLVVLADAPLAIALKTGDPLVPRIAVSTLRARQRERVDFSASLVGGAPLGPGLDYQWYFDGTGTVHGANVSHRFPRPGAYLVLLNVVRGDGTSIGAPDTVTVHVVRPQRRPAGDAHRSGESQGGSGSGNGGTGAGAGGRSGDGGSSGNGSPAFAPAPVPAAPLAASPTPAPVPRHASTPPRHPRGDLVSGTLIASASAAATPVDGAQAARAAVHGAASDGPLHVPIGVWVGAGLALLLALGWALESRHTLPFWQP